VVNDKPEVTIFGDAGHWPSVAGSSAGAFFLTTGSTDIPTTKGALKETEDHGKSQRGGKPSSHEVKAPERARMIHGSTAERIVFRTS
jgi:hypothetical protein